MPFEDQKTLAPLLGFVTQIHARLSSAGRLVENKWKQIGLTNLSMLLFFAFSLFFTNQLLVTIQYACIQLANAENSSRSSSGSGIEQSMATTDNNKINANTDNIIGDKDILQACATALAGVLIFLTIERKVDSKDDNALLFSLTNKEAELKNHIMLGERDIYSINEQAEVTPSQKWRLKGEEEELKSAIEVEKQKYRLVERSLNEEMQRRNLTDEQVATNKKFNKMEGIVTLITLALLSSCIVFMISVPSGWKYYVFDYSLISKLLFSFGLLSLMIRVVMRVEDPDRTIRFIEYLKYRIYRRY